MMNDRPERPRRAPRRDAQRRREALLTAAKTCFQETGYDVPLEIVAERAGVSRGTLYRNFRDRETLALAIFSREVDKFENAFDPEAPIEENLARMIRDGAPVIALFRRLATELKQAEANFAAFEALGDRLERLLAPAVRQAAMRGEIDEAVTPAQFVLALQMAGGLLYSFMGEDEISERIEAALNLLLKGIRPR